MLLLKRHWLKRLQMQQTLPRQLLQQLLLSLNY